MDNKRLVIALVLCAGILFAWTKFFAPTPPAGQQGPAAPQVAADKQGAAPNAPPAPGNAAAAPSSQPHALAPEQRVTLDTRDARFELSSRGAALTQVKLKDPKFWLEKGNPESGQEILRTTTPAEAPLRLSFPKADFSWPQEADWTVTRPSPDQVVFTHDGDGVHVEKRFTALPQRFRLRLDVSVTNKTDRSQSHDLAIALAGAQDQERKGGGFLDYASANLAEMVCNANGKLERYNIETLQKKGPHDATGSIPWIAADEKFFTVAAVPQGQTPSEARRCTLRALNDGVGEATLALAPRAVAAGQTTQYAFEVFAGPKYREDLAAVPAGGSSAELDKLVNVTFAVLSRPMLALLKAFHGFVGNWGLAIILLTIVVKLITFYPAHRALMSGKKMARLQPKLAELRKKYESDRERLAKETMALYKNNGVNMFGGCLPSLIQMPIWIALFSTLNHSVELYHSGFFGYITDLSARDKYFLTPLIMGVVMFIQMRMSPAGADPQQQKMMSVMMPVMFTAFSLFLPSGLAIYTLTNYLLGIIHQLIVNRIDRRAGGASVPAGRPAKA